MGQSTKRIAADADVVKELRRRSRARTSTMRDRELANIILARLDGLSATAVAEKFGTTPSRVDTWTKRFERDGLAGLVELPKLSRVGSQALHDADRIPMAQFSEIDRIVARSKIPLPRPSTMCKILALIVADVAEGRPFPSQSEISRRMQIHAVSVGKYERVLGKLGYIVKDGERWRLHEQPANWSATDETYAEMMSRYFDLRRRRQDFR